MARTALNDVLQNYAFWLMDIAPVEPLALPIFTPLSGFSSISAPEISLETTDIVEGNALYTKHVVKRGSIGNITLSRGVLFWDSDFWRWVIATLRGDTGGAGNLGVAGSVLSVGGPTPRRDLLLIHAFTHSPTEVSEAAAVAITAGLVSTVAGVDVGLSTGSLLTGLAAGGIVGAQFAGAAAAAALMPGPFEFAPRIPARAFLLLGCVPTRYKTGGDFDAMSSEVSIQELDLAVEGIEVITLSI